MVSSFLSVFMQFLLGTGFSRAVYAEPVVLPILNRVYVSTNQSIDPVRGVDLAQVLNPEGLVGFEFTPHGFRLHVILSKTESRAFSVKFDRAPEVRSFEFDQHAFIQNKIYTSGAHAFRSQIETLQRENDVGMLIVISPRATPVFMKTVYDATDLVIHFVKLSSGQVINQVVLDPIANRPNLLELAYKIVSESLGSPKMPQMPPRSEGEHGESAGRVKDQIGFVREKSPVISASFCHRIFN